MAVIHVNDSNFANEIKTGIVLVDFWASWCGPCKMFSPVFESASDKISNIKFLKFEIDDSITSKRIPATYDIRSIPSIVAFKDGNLIETRTGFMDLETLEEWVKELKSK